jgi:hypothetical protein
LKNELDGVGPGPTVSETMLGPPPEKLGPLLLEVLLPLLEVLLPLLLLLDVLVPPPPPQAVTAANANNTVQRRHRSMRISRLR